MDADRTDKFASVRRVEKADRRGARKFLQDMQEAVSCHLHTNLGKGSIQFAEQPWSRNTIHSRPMRFDMICGARHRALADQDRPPVA